MQSILSHNGYSAQYCDAQVVSLVALFLKLKVLRNQFLYRRRELDLDTQDSVRPDMQTRWVGHTALYDGTHGLV